ncbi:MAG TPA: ATP-binding protein [Caulobacteraceae bacterium]|jgi:PAS domain S-box-containing protein
MAVLDRATRIARTLFPGADALIILVQDGLAWRSRDPDGKLYGEKDEAAEVVIATGELLWVADASQDPRFANESMVTGPPYLRGYIAAPIRLEDGSTPGVLAVTGPLVTPYDPVKAARLQDLADFVADEWARAKAAEAQAEAARALDSARTTLAALAATLPISLVMTDAQLRVIAASELWRQEYGADGADITGRPLFDFSPAYEAWRAPLEQALAGGSAVAEPTPIRRADHSVIWMQTEAFAWRDAGGEVAGLIITANDVTRLKEAVENGERAQERLNIALNLADVHVWELDYVRRVLFKAGAEDTFFQRPQTYEDLYRDIYVTIDERDQPAVREAWRRHVEEGARYNPQYRMARTDGAEIWVEGAVTVFTDDRGRPRRMVGAIRNITESKRAEQALVAAREAAETANRAKSTFLATMSHEIRTPMNGVLGMAQAMAADDLTVPQRERLAVIRQSGESLLGLLNDVLDLSKVEAGKLELEAVPFDIDELAKATHATFKGVAEAKGLTFEAAVDHAARGVYLGDPTRVRQIFANLVSNAIKFTETGGVGIHIGRGRHGLVVRVRDTGIGIPRGRVGQLFRKFEQADASTTRKFGGTGLGLAICRELAEAMGGSVKASSKCGEGATFTVRLPLERLSESAAPTPEPARAAPSEPAAHADDEQPPLRILAAEDNQVNQLVLRTLLGQAGVDPVIVDDGKAAIAAWETGEWDLILMDVQMPVMDGPTAARLIREREARTGRPRTPILALTANVMSHQVAEYVAAGMDGFVGKPIEVAALFGAIETALTPAEPELAAAALG